MPLIVIGGDWEETFIEPRKTIVLTHVRPEPASSAAVDRAAPRGASETGRARSPFVTNRFPSRHLNNSSPLPYPPAPLFLPGDAVPALSETVKRENAGRAFPPPSPLRLLERSRKEDE